jgi:cytochrome P450
MTSGEVADALDIDTSPANIEAAPCPWAVYAELRERGRVVRTGRADGSVQYTLTHYDDVAAGLQEPRFSKDAKRIAGLFAGKDPKSSGFVLSGSGVPNLLNLDPPDHTRLRRLVSRGFTHRRVEGLRPRIQQVVDRLLDELATADSPDLIDGFAFQLSITMICELLGVPSERRAEFRTWSTAATTPAAYGLTSTAEGAARLLEFLRAHITAKHAQLAGLTDAREAPDVLSAMIVSRDADDLLTDDELVGMAFLLLIAGHETTVGLIGAMALGLWRQPDQRQLLIDDPGLIEQAVEEFLRYEGSVQRSTFRVAIEDVSIGGAVIPAGSLVTMLITGANHDPDRFERPDELDITRSAQRHVAFGQGIHFCLGAPLARMEAKIAIGSLLRRFPGYAVAVPLETLTYQPTVIRALAALPVSLRGEAGGQA